jgi:hypothetical protein
VGNPSELSWLTPFQPVEKQREMGRRKVTLRREKLRTSMSLEHPPYVSLKTDPFDLDSVTCLWREQVAESPDFESTSPLRARFLIPT